MSPWVLETAGSIIAAVTVSGHTGLAYMPQSSLDLRDSLPLIPSLLAPSLYIGLQEKAKKGVAETLTEALGPLENWPSALSLLPSSTQATVVSVVQGLLVKT